LWVRSVLPHQTSQSTSATDAIACCWQCLYARQCTVGQEVLCSAYCFEPWLQRGLVGRAHADSEPHISQGQKVLYGRGIPIGVWQNQPCHAGAHDSRLERALCRRRYCLDACQRRWHASCHQSRGGLLWRGSGHVGLQQPLCHGHDSIQHHLHERRTHCRRRRVVGGHDQGATGRADRLDRPGVDSYVWPQSGAPQLALHHSRIAVPRHRSRVGESRRRTSVCHVVRRSPFRYCATRARSFQLEAWRMCAACRSRCMQQSC
jgi:hypothetical protein